MRSLFILLAVTTALTACSSQGTSPAASSKGPAKAPQCYNGDSGKFVDVGSVATLSGVNVTCEKTSDGKSAQWMGKKH